MDALSLIVGFVLSWVIMWVFIEYRGRRSYRSNVLLPSERNVRAQKPEGLHDTYTLADIQAHQHEARRGVEPHKSASQKWLRDRGINW